jgi:hypothetical protein
LFPEEEKYRFNFKHYAFKLGFIKLFFQVVFVSKTGRQTGFAEGILNEYLK